MKNTLNIFLILVTFNLQGQTLTNDQLTEDLTQLKVAIQSYNPALNIYSPNFVAQADSLISSIHANDISLIESFGYISQLCALSNEGHFSIGDWDDEVHSGFLDNKYLYLPISVKVLQSNIIVWFDYSTEQCLNRGHEILTVNGIPAKEILGKICSMYPADGQIKTYVDRNIELGFSWMFYLYLNRSDTLFVEAKDDSGRVINCKIRALTRKQQFDNYAEFYPETEGQHEKNEAFHTLRYEGSTAYLTLPSFDYRRIEKFKIKSKRFYKCIFKELKERRTENLIIDLRGNTGGRNEFADDIVPFILKEARHPFLKKTISWEGKTRNYKFPRPSKFAFSGNIFVLVDGRTYSAGSTLARYLNEYASAIVIGEETGTRYEGFAAGSNQVVTLNYSQIRIGIPRYLISFPESMKQPTSNRGLLPQHHIEYSIEELTNNVDLHMKKVHFLITKSKTPQQ